MDTTTQGFGSPLSGLPPLAYLSGLNLGQGGLSGAQDQSLSGSGGTQRSLMPGATGGLGLDELSALLAAQSGDTSGTVGAAGATPFALQALGQQPTQPGGGGYAVAGQSAAPGQQGAQQAAAGSIDPLALIQKLLGLGGKGLQLLGGQSAVGQSGGIGTSDINRSGETGGYTTGIASPINLGEGYGTIGPNGLPVSGTQGQPMIGSGGIPLTGFGETGGYSSTPDLSLVNQAGPGVTPSSIQQVYDAALASGMTNDQILQALSSPGGLDQLSQLVPGQGFEMTAIGGSGSPTGGYATSGQNTVSGGGGGSLSGQSILGGAFGGLTAASSLAQIASAIQSGDFSKIPGGAVGAYQGLSQLLNSGVLGESAQGILPGIQGGGVGLNPAALLGSAIQLLGNDKMGRGDAATLKMATDTISLIQALSAASSGVPYAAIVAQGVSDAMNLANFAQGKQSLAQTAAGSVPIIGGYIQALQAQLDKPSAGYVNNPVVGAMYSRASEALEREQKLLDTIQAAGGPDVFSQEQLGQLLPVLVNDLVPYYAGGGGTTPGARFKDDPTGAAAWTATYNKAAGGVTDIVQNLLKRGMTYEQLGQLGGFAPWTADINSGITPETYYGYRANDYNPIGATLATQAKSVQNPSGYWYTDPNSGQQTYITPENAGTVIPQSIQLSPMDMLRAAEASALSVPEQTTHQRGLIESMFGGPLWTALARMNAAPGVLSGQGGLISQHFNPWATIGGFNPQQLQASLQPILQDQLAGMNWTGGSAPSDAGIGVGEGF